jgi:FixJ family two-component response regulator
VLVVDNDADVRRSTQLLLEDSGFDVRAYAAADPLLLDENIDDAACLVADQCLAGRDGIGLLGALRRQGWTSPAILVTGHPLPELRQAAQAVGFDEFFEKPLGDRLLVNAVTKLTGRQPDVHG